MRSPLAGGRRCLYGDRYYEYPREPVGVHVIRLWCISRDGNDAYGPGSAAGVLLAYSAGGRVSPRTAGSRPAARLGSRRRWPPRRRGWSGPAVPAGPAGPASPIRILSLTDSKYPHLPWKILASWRILRTPVPKNFHIARNFQDLFRAGRIRVHPGLMAHAGTTAPPHTTATVSRPGGEPGRTGHSRALARRSYAQPPGGRHTSPRRAAPATACPKIQTPRSRDTRHSRIG